MFLQLTDENVKALDEYGTFKQGKLLQNLSYCNMSVVSEAGATGVTVSVLTFVAPVKMKITGVKALTHVANVGSSNAPTISLEYSSNVIASGVKALSGAAGDVDTLALNSDTTKLEVPAGGVLIFKIVNPTATITTAWKGMLSFVWNAIA